MYGLSDQTKDLIINCLSRFEHIEEAILYGSRAKGNPRTGSDIDITLKGSRLTFQDLLRIENALDDLMLPYKIDLSLFSFISNPDLVEHINRVGVVIYRRNNK